MIVRLLLCALLLGAANRAALCQEERDKTEAVAAMLELSDGSRLKGVPLDSSIRVDLEFGGGASVPLSKVRTCEFRAADRTVVLTLVNGDRLTGKVRSDEFPVHTVLGQLRPALAQIRRIDLRAQPDGGMPAGEGMLTFGGVNWTTWRTLFEVRDDKLVSLPQSRPGFQYGHDGHGRGPGLVTNIGNPDWKDYSIEFEFCMAGADPAFNPYGLPLDYYGGSIMFHVVDARESWNECGSSLYELSLDKDGGWKLSCRYNSFCRQATGYGNALSDGERTLAEGRGLRLDHSNGNRFRLDIAGHRIRIWMDGEKLVDVVDQKMGDRIAGKRLDHGGVGFGWVHDTMGWIRNFSARPLPDHELAAATLPPPSSVAQDEPRDFFTPK